MIDIIQLLNAMRDTFQRIPELVALLEGGPDGVMPYLDINPDRNKLGRAVYQSPAGSLLIAWMGTGMVEATTTMEGWDHAIQIFVKAQRGASPLAILNALVDGVPVPGDGLRWRFCPLLPGTLPTTVRELSRIVDEENIDYYVVSTVTRETGDDPPPYSAA